MLLMTHFPVLKSWKTSILASDYSAKMLQRIQQGEYSQLEVGRGLPAPMLVKFFKRQGLKWVANPEMRRLIETRRMNLAAPWNGTQDYDIVFLRNVLIYFDPNTRLEILQRICQSMKPTGYLFPWQQRIAAVDSQRTVPTRLRRRRDVLPSKVVAADRDGH